MRPSAATAYAIVVLVLAAVPAAGANQPKAVLDATSFSAGDTVHIRGSGWGRDPSQVARITVCGNDGLNGSRDCDVANTTEAGIHADGTFTAAAPITIPAEPCPCVLRVATLGVSSDVRVPIEIAGTLSATPARARRDRRAVVVSDVHVVNRGGILSVLGLRPRRALHYRITNSGDVPLHDPAVDVTWGRSSHPTGFVPAEKVGDLEPGTSRQATVPLPLGFPAVGSFHAGVRVDPLGQVSTAQASALVLPWWLLLLPAPVAYGVRVVRRRKTLAAHLVAPSSPVAVAGWYWDPTDGTRLRLWDGSAWSSATRVLVEERVPVSV